MRFLTFIAVVVLTGCAAVEMPSKTEEAAVPLALRPAAFADLPGWDRENFMEFLPVFMKSCDRMAKKSPADDFGPLDIDATFAVWQSICSDMTTQGANPAALKSFIEARFQPYQVLAGDNPEGLFTGYYEASLKGSYKRSSIYNIPLYTRPDDLVMVDLGEFREELKGQRIAGRVTDGNLKPYEDRAAIVAGNWPHNDKVLVWVNDPVDAFFVQVQGSGVVEMDDGSVLRIGYAGQNGHVYYAIGRELVKRGHLTKENVSMQAIAEWLRTHPGEADEIMNSNRSYVFFKDMGDAGATGGEGVVLTPGRSLAVDRSLLPYGLPLWVDIEPPIEGQHPIRRLMVAQDTGGAIRGPVRGDVFWGYGAQAEAQAGPMKSPGRYWALLPR